MKEHPILFSAPMVRALLNGSKTQTRRVVKAKHLEWLDNSVLNFLDGKWNQRPLPYGRPGDRLWVRETFAHIYRDNAKPAERRDDDVSYRADYRGLDEYAYGTWKPSIHMPRWASRITLEVTSVRVERLTDISPSDCEAEGVQPLPLQSGEPRRWYSADFAAGSVLHSRSTIGAYHKLWESINGPGSWDANPWVWAIGFKVTKP